MVFYPDSLRYRLVFDAAREGFRDWGFAAFGLIFIGVGVGLFLVAKRIDPKAATLFRVFGGLFAGFAALWTLTAFGSTFGQYSSLRHALETGAYTTIEGTVSDFVPGDIHGRNVESFTVAGHPFSYSPYIVTPGFRKTRSEGGPIYEGLNVRIAVVDGEIALLEIAPTGPPPPMPTFAVSPALPVSNEKLPFRWCWPFGIVGLAWLWGGFLVFRVSAFRIDRKRGGYFGVPYFGNWKYLYPSNFTEEGRPILRWMWASQALFVAGALLSMGYCIK